ncbi:MAG TPA: PAS domain-containing sensor histidine kinase [Bacteroidales bacterium]|nr:PAS domain-containing sensor histidine kinase [Bacteroidales bacterium]
MLKSTIPSGQGREEFLESIINQQPLPICRFLPDTTITYVNKAYCNYFRKEASDLLGTRWIELHSKNEQQKIWKHLQRVAEQKIPLNFQRKTAGLNCKTVWESWNDTPLFDSEDKLEGFQSYMIDLSQLRFPHTLEMKRDFLNSILCTIDDVIWAAELEPFKIVFLSDPILELTGYKPEEFYQNPELVNCLEADFDSDIMVKMFNQAYYNGFAEATFPIVDRNGVKKHVQNKMWLIRNQEGLPMRFEGIVSDISQRENSKQNPCAWSHDKDNLLATVAHDLRNPISGIIGIANMLDRRNLSAEHLSYTNLIRMAGQSALTLIDEILEVSELEQQCFCIKQEKVLVNEMLFQIVAPFEHMAKEKKVAVKTALPEKEIFSSLDQKKFTRVIENILSNALKFTPEGGNIILELAETENTIRISISDTGIGIPEALQPYLFDKFSEARRQGLTGEKSHGLGLYIARKIVELHKGRLHFSSQENQGATFVIELNKTA